MANRSRLDVYGFALLGACTEQAVAAFPHLATLRARALAGSVQALSALIHACDSLALPTWHTHDRSFVVALRDEARAR